jgi:hypothetical protein
MTAFSASLSMMPPAGVPSVMVTPGFSAFTRIRRKPSSFDGEIEIESIAPFVGSQTVLKSGVCIQTLPEPSKRGTLPFTTMSPWSITHEL